MRIAITGGSGFIGKWFIKEFGEKYKCVIFGRKKDINELKIAGEKYKYIRTDFSNDQLVKQLEGFDAVIHLAAIKYTKDRTRLSDYEDNIRISENLLKVCSQLNISNFVFASTRSIYSDKFNKIPFLENENVFPQNLYALSKLIVEKLGFMYESISFKALRFAQIVGWGEREGYMLTTFLSRALKKEELTVFGEGKGERDYLYAKDATNAIIAAIRKPKTKGVFNIGLGKGTSHRELAETINEVFENTNNIRFLHEYLEDKSIQLMSIDKAKQMLNWKPHWTLKEALFDMKTILINDS